MNFIIILKKKFNSIKQIDSYGYAHRIKVNSTKCKFWAEIYCGNISPFNSGLAIGERGLVGRVTFCEFI
jgi:hypothetical protein